MTLLQTHFHASLSDSSSAPRARKLLPCMAVALGLGLFACDDSETPPASDGVDVPVAQPTADGCTRESLRSTVDAYFAALAAHDPSAVPLDANVKYTENGEVVAVGDGLWQTAGEAKVKIIALDTETCSAGGQAVVPESGEDRVYGLRIKREAGAISEIESIIIRAGSYFTPPDPGNLARIDPAVWETLLPEGQQPTREKLKDIVDRYFVAFPAGACDFAPECIRIENGLSILGCDFLLSCNRGPLNPGPDAMTTHAEVLDTEAGIGVGFTMFMGAYTDLHMFNVGADGQVLDVHAVLSAASSSGWE